MLCLSVVRESLSEVFCWHRASSWRWASEGAALSPSPRPQPSELQARACPGSRQLSALPSLPAWAGRKQGMLRGQKMGRQQGPAAGVRDEGASYSSSLGPGRGQPNLQAAVGAVWREKAPCPLVREVVFGEKKGV